MVTQEMLEKTKRLAEMNEVNDLFCRMAALGIERFSFEDMSMRLSVKKFLSLFPNTDLLTYGNGMKGYYKQVNGINYFAYIDEGKPIKIHCNNDSTIDYCKCAEEVSNG